MSTPLDHARHNRKACDTLHAAKDFSDWVVTTAFYSAMHYFHAVIFPFTELGIVYKSIDEYFNKHKKVGDTKHSVTIDLVQKKHISIADKYKQLKDVAQTARYHDYEILKPVVDKMRKNLKSIEEYCEAEYIKKHPKKEDK